MQDTPQNETEMSLKFLLFRFLVQGCIFVQVLRMTLGHSGEAFRILLGDAHDIFSGKHMNTSFTLFPMIPHCSL